MTFPALFTIVLSILILYFLNKEDNEGQQ
ncbi:Protein of unknown function [Bacillus toyonensis]|nr:Protein of unknown function [Bacillus toyonensis]